jgi:protease-4
MARLSSILTNIFVIILILQFLPLLIKTFKKHYTELTEPHTKVGVITINQPLSSSSPYTKQLKSFFENSEIKAILLKIDCPGGAAGSSQAIFYTIKELKRTWSKPLIVVIENLCTSGAYYIAGPADWIIGPASAMVGSIGVYMPHPQLKAFIEQFKIKYEVIKSGEYKTAGNPLLDSTPEQKAMLQELSSDVYMQFVKDIAECRPQLKIDEHNTWAQGRVFTGNKALEKGLIDEIGSIETAEKVIRQKAAVEGKIIWVKAPQPSKWARFFGHDDENDNEESLFENVSNHLQGWWSKQNIYGFW